MAKSYTRSVFLSFAVCLSTCLARSSLEYLSGVPKSTEYRYARYFDTVGNHPDRPHWNPSAQIDKDGFLSKSYRRMASESEEHIEGIHGKSTMTANPVRVRQVPGDGNCLFHCLVVCLNWVEKDTHYCYKDYHELRRLSHSLRKKAINYLTSKPNRKLYLYGNEYMDATHLLETAAESCNTTPETYCEQMRQESYWGGGPEVVALCNLLRRPIHVYELYGSSRKEFRFRRMSHFGSPRFDKKEALHILSADSRFPDVRPGKQKPIGQHFLALFPEAMTSKRKRGVRVRGGRRE